MLILLILLLQEKMNETQLQQQQQQQDTDKQAAAHTASQKHIKLLAHELSQQNSALQSLQEQLQQTQQSRDMIQGQVEAWRAQHAQQAPRLAELVSERQAWVEDLQRERANASAAAAAAEVSVIHLLLSEIPLKGIKERSTMYARDRSFSHAKRK